MSTFHLSIGVKSIEESINFFVGVLNGKILHRDPSGYVNVDVLSAQITLKENSNINPTLPDFHFGFNLPLNEFDELAQAIMKFNSAHVAVAPTIVDPNTPLERKKMYLKEPTGYLVELKGYR